VAFKSPCLQCRIHTTSIRPAADRTGDGTTHFGFRTIPESKKEEMGFSLIQVD